MGTISRQIAADIIFTSKYADDNPVKIVTYRNMFDGSLTYAVVFAHEPILRYEMSPACEDVRTVWIAPPYFKTPFAGEGFIFDKHGLTHYGTQLFKEELSKIEA
jgi:hypothetical protein